LEDTLKRAAPRTAAAAAESGQRPGTVGVRTSPPAAAAGNSARVSAARSSPMIPVHTVRTLRHCAIAALLAVAAPMLVPDAAAADATPPAQAKPAPQTADVAAPKLGKDGQPDKGFMDHHEMFLKRGKEGPIGVLFIGDSITAGWGRAKDTWQQHYGAHQPANFGIGGDRTQHVLWRIENGELDGIAPKVVVLMIGTNNIGEPAENIIKGDLKICAEIHAKLPEAKLLLLGIFPRGPDPKDPLVAPLRAKIKTVNEQLAKLDDGAKTRYLDIGGKFLDADGTLPKDIMPDGLHPNPKGYEIWATAMQPLLDEMLK
jgi:lysophospholipase L1-like esterase